MTEMFGTVSTTLSDGGVLTILIGYVLLVIVSARMGILSWRASRRAGRPQIGLWRYFLFVGLAGSITGFVGLLELLTAMSGMTAVLLLGVAVLLALTMREAYYTTTLSNTETERFGQFQFRQAGEILLVVVVPIAAIGVFVTNSPVITGAVAIAALIAIGYGVYFQQKRIREPATRGTLIDTLLRQSFPVLVFTGAAAVVPLFEQMEDGAAISYAATTAFVLLSVGFLLSISLKLSQHLTTR